jgi:hypothetical protein
MRNSQCPLRTLRGHFQASAIALRRGSIAGPATTFSPCISMPSGPRCIAGKTRFSFNASGAATKRRSGWRARKDRWKRVNPDSCRWNRRTCAVEVGSERQCQIETRARHLRKRKQVAQWPYCPYRRSLIRHFKNHKQSASSSLSAVWPFPYRPLLAADGVDR